MAVRHWSYDVAFSEKLASTSDSVLFVPSSPTAHKITWFASIKLPNFKLFSLNVSPPSILHQPSFINTMASHPETKIDCSKVYVKQSSFSNEQTGMFDGAFALVDIKEGELVEKGVMRRLPEGFDGNTCPYIFTWSTERPNKVNMI